MLMQDCLVTPCPACTSSHFCDWTMYGINTLSPHLSNAWFVSCSTQSSIRPFMFLLVLHSVVPEVANIQGCAQTHLGHPQCSLKSPEYICSTLSIIQVNYRWSLIGIHLRAPELLVYRMTLSRSIINTPSFPPLVALASRDYGINGALRPYRNSAIKQPKNCNSINMLGAEPCRRSRVCSIFCRFVALR